MTISSGVCVSFKADVLNGIHQPDDEYKIALYSSSATLDSTTLQYTTAGEVVGEGYTAGGRVLEGRTVAISDTVAYLDWSDVAWAAATITARGALVYNATRGNKAVAVFDFGSDVSSTASTFEVVMPEPGANTAVVRIA